MSRELCKYTENEAYFHKKRGLFKGDRYPVLTPPVNPARLRENRPL